MVLARVVRCPLLAGTPPERLHSVGMRSNCHKVTVKHKSVEIRSTLSSPPAPKAHLSEKRSAAVALFICTHLVRHVLLHLVLLLLPRHGRLAVDPQLGSVAPEPNRRHNYWYTLTWSAAPRDPLGSASCGTRRLSESLGSAKALSGSVHTQAVFTAANGPREVCVSLRHPTVSMPSRDAKSHGTDVPWNGDEEDWPRARDMYHAILRDEFGSDVADMMWHDKVLTDSFDFDVGTACLSILHSQLREAPELQACPVAPPLTQRMHKLRLCRETSPSARRSGECQGTSADLYLSIQTATAAGHDGQAAARSGGAPGRIASRRLGRRVREPGR